LFEIQLGTTAGGGKVAAGQEMPDCRFAGVERGGGGLRRESLKVQAEEQAQELLLPT